MITNFCQSLCIDYPDVNVAVLLENFAHWILINATKDNPAKRNYREGRFWTYNTLEEMSSMYQMWTPRQLRTITKKAVEMGLLIKSKFNRANYDRTSWYTLTDKALEYYPLLLKVINGNLAKMEADKERRARHRKHKKERMKPGDFGFSTDNAVAAIPRTTTTSSSYIKRHITAATENGQQAAIQEELPAEEIIFTLAKPSKVNLRDMIDIYREEFPDNPQTHLRVISTELANALSTFVKRWPEHHPEGKQMDLDQFRAYLQMLRTKAPRFSLGTYETKEGRLKKNGLLTFVRWNTCVKFLEGAYS